MSGLEVFNIAFYLVEKEVLTIGREDQSTQDWVNIAESIIFEFLFRQGYRKKEDCTNVMPFAMSNNGFDHVDFINEANTEGYKKVA